MSRLPFALLALLLLLPAIPTSTAQQFEPTTVVIDGPRAIAPGEQELFHITVTGGPAAEENGTFEIVFVLQGDNLAGGDPQVDRTQANREGVFDVNITAPEAEGFVLLFVRATSRGDEVNDTAESRHSITVAQPVTLDATLRNRGAAAALDIEVQFFVDGENVGNQTVPRIEAGGEARVSFTYVPIGLLDGTHTARIEADINGDGNISPELGELVTQNFFYRTERSNLPAIFGTLTVIILFLLVFVLLAIRRQRRMG